jgi:coatomer protein complex subunit gamma
VIEENPEAKENGLSHLCEFIEDCEHTSLAVKILHLLGRNLYLVRVVDLLQVIP